MNDKQQKAFQLEQEARLLRAQAFQEEQRAKYAAEKAFAATTGLDVYASDDYAGLRTKDVDFYYGYERTVCKHEVDYCGDCEDAEWAFTATRAGEELMRLPTSKLTPKTGEEPLYYLLAGIGHYLST
jgi:hypothetical protein